MTYQQYLSELKGKTVYIEQTDGQPHVVISIDEDDGDRGEIVDVGADFVVLRYKRRLRKDVVTTHHLSMISVVADA